jgi:hypothetical protein
MGLLVFPGLAHVEDEIIPFPVPGHVVFGLLGVK